MLDGVASPADLVARAADLGMPALALTDTGGLYGAISFYKAALRAGIKPILGVELDETVVLARNREGYARLCAMISAFHLADRFDLADFLDDTVWALSGDIDVLDRLQARGAYPLAAVTHTGDAASREQAVRVLAYAQQQGLIAVAVHPVYFLEERQAHIHRILRAVHANTSLIHLAEEDGRCGDATYARSSDWRFLSSQDMEALYGEWPEILANTDRVAETCELELELGTPQFPACEVGEGESSFSQLWRIAFDGVRRRYRPMTPEVARRLQYELDIIYELGFAPYFLIVADIVQYALTRGIPIVGRGSAANSLVAYALGITRADPLRYNLYFERFLNLSRSDCPDIDLDICWKRRDEVVDYVYNRYGADRVAMVCTFNRFRARGAVREVAKAFGLPERAITRITRRIPPYHAGDIRSLVRHLPECRDIPIDQEPLCSILEIAEFIDGFPRHLSVHAGGLVIAPEGITQFVPLQRATKGIVITQFDKDDIEELGLVKMDLLGHRSLTVIAETVQAVKANRGIEMDIERLPDSDALTAALTRTGQTIGCFQIESPAMRSLLRNTRADSVDMLIKTLSLVRPGPSGSGMKKRFIDRHLGREIAESVHPAFDAVLDDTHGVMLYQEDILKVAHAVAGMSLAEADGLRRAMTKKRSRAEMAAHMKQFVEKAVANGVEPAVAESIWEQIANFAKYSFCKAHACTYGEMAYQCAYLKAHFPAEFLAAVISNRGGFYHTAVYVEEARRLGVSVRPPDVNHSRYEYTLEGEAIRMGFLEIRHLTHTAIRAMLRQREQGPFISLTDLYHRTGMTRSDGLALVASGACDGFGLSRPSLLWELRLLHVGDAPRESAEQPLLFREGRPQDLIPARPEYSRSRRVRAEWEALGFLVTEHPFMYSLPLLSDAALVLSPALPRYVGKTVTMAGWLIAERRVGLPGRGAMMFLTLEDPAGVFEAILFPAAYQRWGHLLTTHGPFVITGQAQVEEYTCSLIVERMEKMGDRPPTPGMSAITPPLDWILGEGSRMTFSRPD